RSAAEGRPEDGDERGTRAVSLPDLETIQERREQGGDASRLLAPAALGRHVRGRRARRRFELDDRLRSGQKLGTGLQLELWLWFCLGLRLFLRLSLRLSLRLFLRLGLFDRLGLARLVHLSDVR